MCPEGSLIFVSWGEDFLHIMFDLRIMNKIFSKKKSAVKSEDGADSWSNIPKHGACQERSLKKSYLILGSYVILN